MQDVWQFRIGGEPHEVVLGPGDWFARRPRWFRYDATVVRLPFYIRRYHESRFSVAGHAALLTIGVKPPPFRQRLRNATGKQSLWTGLGVALMSGLVSGGQVAETEAFTLGYVLGGPAPDRLAQELLIDGVSLGQRVR